MRNHHTVCAVVVVGLLANGCSAAPGEDVDRSTAPISSGNLYNFGAIAHPGSCMDAQSGGTADGTQIQEWTCNGTGAQSFQMADAGSGAVYLVNTQANKCVDVQARGTANGTKIQLWDCNQTTAQTFVTRDAGDGFVYFVNTNSNKCLDVQADNPDDGTIVQLYDCNGTNAQRWNTTVIGTTSGGGGTPPPAPTPSPAWTLTWSDEFNGANGSGVDPNNWAFDTGGERLGQQRARVLHERHVQCGRGERRARHHRDDRRRVELLVLVWPM